MIVFGSAVLRLTLVGSKASDILKALRILCRTCKGCNRDNLKTARRDTYPKARKSQTVKPLILILTGSPEGFLHANLAARRTDPVGTKHRFTSLEYQ